VILIKVHVAACDGDVSLAEVVVMDRDSMGDDLTRLLNFFFLDSMLHPLYNSNRIVVVQQKKNWRYCKNLYLDKNIQRKEMAVVDSLKETIWV
jgi:hypothetical protein